MIETVFSLDGEEETPPEGGETMPSGEDQGSKSPAQEARLQDGEGEEGDGSSEDAE